ncbi:neutral ceramidase [Nocardioides albertanoniae]|uniref:Neutral ceramidase n=1 Tax=Nocardioides albertanoniae TaxID=1175486 RepID=A0A543A6Y7_9ACTN|nr:neutral/alkaline non-lysosomal ceramidase N-terminal domain-containing protein [Nocardioides albertanoniae]TQL68338.1 neutral ceramidase [Nocardioides albertanoniae]
MNPLTPSTRRRPRLLVALSALGLALVTAVINIPSTSAEATTTPHATAAGTSTPTSGTGWLAGRGIADVTGEPLGVGMMGYADTSQFTEGLHQRQRSRAFVIEDRASGRRFVHVTADIGMIFSNIRNDVMDRLAKTYGDTYGEQNVMLTATHTHAGAAGFSHYNMYNLFSGGQHEGTESAIVDGIFRSIVRAHDDLAPAELSLGISEVDDANVNRSREAYDRNPAGDKAFFGERGTDTQSTTMSIRRNGKLDGVINWFPVHATSLPTSNKLISPDNKGYAEYHWEREARGVDYVTDSDDPGMVSAFAQTNAGDMSPNLALKPGTGPTDDPFKNTRIIGGRQYQGALRGTEATQQELSGGLDSRLVYVDMSKVEVGREFTPDGKVHHTCKAALGAPFAAGSTEDGGGGLPIFKEGKDGGNPVFDLISKIAYTASPALKACQAPKEIALPVGVVGMVQQKLPVQLVRIGDLYLVGLPQEVTITSGLRLRREVAEVTGAPIDHILVNGYANAYAHYLTTPEEYDSQEYEGGSTLFGRYQLPAYQQVVSELATSIEQGTELEVGTRAGDPAYVPGTPATVSSDSLGLGLHHGDVLTEPSASNRTGEEVKAVFAAANPDNDLRHGDTYLSVERRTGSGWVRVADDGDWSTKIRWATGRSLGIDATVTWVPEQAGTYRMRYFGAARKPLGAGLKEFSGTTRTFQVR